jgi:Kelch motif
MTHRVVIFRVDVGSGARPTYRRVRSSAVVMTMLIAASACVAAVVTGLPGMTFIAGDSQLTARSDPAGLAHSGLPSSSPLDPCGADSTACCAGAGINASASSWTNVSTCFTVAPSARSDAAFAYDGQSSSLVLFGGHQGSIDFGDTWEFSSGGWTNVTPPAPNGTNTPTARFGASVAYDNVSGEIVLFGGMGPRGFDNDTWTWTTTGWHEVPTAVAPSARDYAAMAFDARLGVVVLFGGNNLTGARSDTWEFNGVSWTNVTTSVLTPPTARYEAGVAYDPVEQAVVLFGGFGTGGVRHDTWTFNGSGWRDLGYLNLTNSPPGRLDPQMTFDPLGGTVVLYGGAGLKNARWGDVWRFSAGNWTNVSSSAGPAFAARSGGGMAFLVTPDNPPGEEMVLFGGSLNQTLWASDTWLYGNSLPLGVPPPWTPRTLFDDTQPIRVLANVIGGVGPYRYSWQGGLQEVTGCLTNNSSQIDCTPSPITSTESFAVLTVVTDSGPVTTVGGSALLTIAPKLTVTAFYTSPGTPVAGQSFSLIVTAQGGIAPRNYSYLGLPTGCPSENLAKLSCLGTSVGDYFVVVTVTDAVGGLVMDNDTVVVVSPGTSSTNSLTTLDVILGVAIGGAAVVLIGAAVYWRSRPPPPSTGGGG